MNKILNASLLIVCGIGLPNIAGCASDFVADRSRPAPTRAVEEPTYHNDAHGEEMAGTAKAVPLVSVQLPNKEGQPTQVRTIADNVRDTLNPPTTTAPAAVTTPGQPTPHPTPVRIDPITGQPY